MEPLSDDELSEILRQLEASPAPPTLESRLFGCRSRQSGTRWWRRSVSCSVRIPVPALALTVLAGFALGTFAFRVSLTRPLSARGASAFDQVVTRDPSVAIDRPAAGKAPEDKSYDALHPGGATAPDADSRAARIDGGTLSVPRGAADRNLVASPEPYYPPDAKNAGLQGVVKLRIRIDKDGRVTDATVIGGSPVLASAAVEAVKQRIYRPTLLNGSPIAVISQADVVFRLDVTLVSSLKQ